MGRHFKPMHRPAGQPPSVPLSLEVYEDGLPPDPDHVCAPNYECPPPKRPDRMWMDAPNTIKTYFIPLGATYIVPWDPGEETYEENCVAFKTQCQGCLRAFGTFSITKKPVVTPSDEQIRAAAVALLPTLGFVYGEDEGYTCSMCCTDGHDERSMAINLLEGARPAVSPGDWFDWEQVTP
jgi:hypothetical protein